MLFIGDSNVRQLFFALVRQVDGEKAFGKSWETEGDKHTDRNAVVTAPDGEKVTLDFWW